MNKELQKLSRLSQIVYLCNRESDKGTVLTITSLIVTTMQEIEYPYATTAPPTTLSKRIRMACAAGLISPQEMDTIQKVFMVRNKLVRVAGGSFESRHIQSDMKHLANLLKSNDTDCKEKIGCDITHRVLFINSSSKATYRSCL